MLRVFTVGFEKVLKSCLLLDAASTGLIEIFCAAAGLRVPTMVVYAVATKILDRELFPQHNITELNSGITFTVLFSQEKSLQ